jgi:hypothetical protein
MINNDIYNEIRKNMKPRTTADLIKAETNAIQGMLLEKNRKYGDSALKPQRIFSKADAVEQIKVRIDDKLSRITSAQADDNEDAELDLIGYLILLRIAKRHQVLSHGSLPSFCYCADPEEL